MSRPRLLDLYCKEGGAAMGYYRAGFDVVGVDINPQPRYPFKFHQADALEFLHKNAQFFDAVHASPPCQAHTTMSNRHRGKGGKADSWPDLIALTRLNLQQADALWVIENVPGARSKMRDPATLHGGMFGLRVYRPRLFESNFPITVQRAKAPADPVGVYGKSPDGRRLFTRKDGSIQRAAASLAEGQEAMGMPWATWDGVREAIPPAYTEYIGRQLLAHLDINQQEAA